MQASKPRQAGTSRRERIAAARLIELAAEARAGWDPTTLERLIVKTRNRRSRPLPAFPRPSKARLLDTPMPLP